MWVRQLKSGQQVSYDDLPLQEVRALATALDEWEFIIQKKKTPEIESFWGPIVRKVTP